MKEQVPILIGEAAKSWVELQWYEFYVGLGFVVVIIGALGLLVRWIIREFPWG